MINLHLPDSDLESNDVSYMQPFYPHEYETFKVNVPISKRQDGWLGEHYRLLHYIANQFKGVTILEGGTAHGMSCLAMADSPNKIVTYETNGGWGVQRWVVGVSPGEPYNSSWQNGSTECKGRGRFENVTFKLKDINTEDADILLASELMFIDVDPHDGIQETIFFDRLRSIGYTGVVVLDDIHLFPEMEKFWNSITEKKWDLTPFGHHSGTGIVDFGDNITITGL